MPNYDPTPPLTVPSLSQTFKAPEHIIRKVMSRLDLGYWVGRLLILHPREMETFKLGLRVLGYPANTAPASSEALQPVTQEATP
jgi:hypothetical protein